MISSLNSYLFLFAISPDWRILNIIDKMVFSDRPSDDTYTYILHSCADT